MNFLIIIFKVIFYFPITLINLCKLKNHKRILFLDLDYTLCDNKALKNKPYYNPNLYDYEQDIPLNENILKLTETYTDFNVIVLSARGLRSERNTKKWLMKKNLHFPVISIGDPWLKIIPIFYCLMFSKKVVLIDDITINGNEDHKSKPFIIKNFNDKITYIDSKSI